jgi:branched-chain amino acid transport system ATP-binding protein
MTFDECRDAYINSHAAEWRNPKHHQQWNNTLKIYCTPIVILLDEPTSGVSTADKHTIMEVLVSAAKAAGVSGIVQVEHDMDLVERYSHRIVALQEGRVVADMSPAAFFADASMIAAVVGTRANTIRKTT